jgi:hypothetical protein
VRADGPRATHWTGAAMINRQATGANFRSWLLVEVWKVRFRPERLAPRGL